MFRFRRAEIVVVLRACTQETAGRRPEKGPIGSTLLGHALHAVTCRGAIFVFGLYIAFFLRFTSHVLLNMEFLLFLLGHIFAGHLHLGRRGVGGRTSRLLLRCARAQAGMLDLGREDHAGRDPPVREGRGHRRYGANIDQGLHIPRHMSQYRARPHYEALHPHHESRRGAQLGRRQRGRCGR